AAGAAISAGDPDAGAVVYLDDIGDLEIKAPALRAEIEQSRYVAWVENAKAEHGGGNAVEERIAAENPDKEEPGRDPLLKAQQLALHRAKTHTLRRVIADDFNLATALGVIGLLGAGEVRLGARGYEKPDTAIA